jgi:hypothetical protein
MTVVDSSYQRDLGYKTTKNWLNTLYDDLRKRNANPLEPEAHKLACKYLIRIIKAKIAEYEVNNRMLN